MFVGGAISEIILRQGIVITISDGYTRRKEGVIHKDDIAWVSSKQIWTEPTEFMIETDVAIWHVIAKKKLPSNLSKLIKTNQVNTKRR